MIKYTSESARANAVFRYFLVAYVGSMVTYAMLTAVSAYVGILNVPIILLLITGQNITWLVTATLMCAVLGSLTTPPTPPKEKWKTVQTSNKVSGNTDVTEIVREKTWKV